MAMFFAMLTIPSRQMCFGSLHKTIWRKSKEFAVRDWSWQRSGSGIKIQSIEFDPADIPMVASARFTVVMHIAIHYDCKCSIAAPATAPKGGQFVLHANPCTAIPQANLSRTSRKTMFRTVFTNDQDHDSMIPRPSPSCHATLPQRNQRALLRNTHAIQLHADPVP
jgi:hypothetical protein